MKRFVVVTVLVPCAFLVATCDQRRCVTNADCVAREACSAGLCVAEGEGAASEGEGTNPGEGEGTDVGEGEGTHVGEGEGATVGEGEGSANDVCAGVQCDPGRLCVEVTASPFAGSCVPTSGTVTQCANVQGGGESSPLANGPAIWNATAVTDIATDCADPTQTRVGGSFRFYDAVGTTSFTGHSLIVVRNDEDANNYFPDATPTYDSPAHPGVSGIVSYSVCIPTLATELLFELDDDDIGSSNTLCVTR